MRLTITILVTLLLFSPVFGMTQNLQINRPNSVSFQIPLQSGQSTVDLNGAKNIASSLFYIALLIGVINIVRTMVFNPDRSKKVIVNWCVGLIIYSTVYNLFG